MHVASHILPVRQTEFSLTPVKPYHLTESMNSSSDYGISRASGGDISTPTNKYELKIETNINSGLFPSPSPALDPLFFPANSPEDDSEEHSKTSSELHVSRPGLTVVTDMTPEASRLREGSPKRHNDLKVNNQEHFSPDSQQPTHVVEHYLSVDSDNLPSNAACTHLDVSKYFQILGGICFVGGLICFAAEYFSKSPREVLDAKVILAAEILGGGGLFLCVTGLSQLCFDYSCCRRPIRIVPIS